LKSIITSSGKIKQSRAYKGENPGVEISFIKLNNGNITYANISKCISVQTIQGTALDELFCTLRAVWQPIIENENDMGIENREKGENGKGKISPRVLLLMAQLESALCSKDNNGIKGDSYTDIANSSYCPPDIESLFRHLNADRLIDQSLLKLSFLESKEIDKLEFSEIIDRIDLIINSLNSAWTLKISQEKMEQIFDCISKAICRFIQFKMKDVNIWQNGSTGDVRIKLQTSIRICRAFCDIPKKLCTSYWIGSNNIWEGGCYSNSFLIGFKNRLEQVLQIHSLADEMSQLLNPNEKEHFKLGQLFSSLYTLNPLLYNPYTEPQWNDLVNTFEDSIGDIVSAAVSRLKKYIAPLTNNPDLFLHELLIYKNLLKRSNVREALSKELSSLISLQRGIVKTVEATVEDVESEQCVEDDKKSSFKIDQNSKKISPIISRIILLRKSGSKLSTLYSFSSEILRDVEDFTKFSSHCEKVIARTKDVENKLLQTWVSNMVIKLDDSSDERYSIRGSILSWCDGKSYIPLKDVKDVFNGSLIVVFSEYLLQFLFEVQHLYEIGINMNSFCNISSKVVDLEKYYRFGTLLKKTSNFFNSVKEQMIPIQQGLFLHALHSFLTLAAKFPSPPIKSKNNGSGYSDFFIEFDKYIRKLQESVENLSIENRWLRKQHEILRSSTANLMTIDLLRKPDVWKAKWRILKDTMTVVRNKFSEKDSATWILHCDHQLYKSMEASYQMGLASLTQNLPEIKVDLVFANKRLEFKPPLEEIRDSFYRDMKKFMGMPNSFDGFGNKYLYKKIGVKNSGQLIFVFRRAELLLEKFNSLILKYFSTINLGRIDIDQYIEQNIKDQDDYEKYFMMLNDGHISLNDQIHINSIPDFEKIDFYIVNLSPLKIYLEELRMKVRDTLLIMLRRSLMQEFKEVNMFLESGNERLRAHPQTLEEIASLKIEYKEFEEKRESIMKLSDVCVVKKNLLLQYSPGTPIDVSEVKSFMSNLDGEGGRWDEFKVAMEDFDRLIEEETKSFGAKLGEDLRDFENTQMGDIAKFTRRWNDSKPGSSVKNWEYSHVKKTFDLLDDLSKQYSELKEKAESLVESCKVFGMETPVFSKYEDVSIDVVNTNKSWILLREYYTELNKMSEEDWLTFSTNVFVLQDFATSWSDKIKSLYTKGSYDGVATYVISATDQIIRAIPALKYCRGEPFTEDHWSELLQGKLQLPNDVRRENVNLNHFLSRINILLESKTVSFVKNLQSRAMGEVQIREGFLELRGWERSADIKLLTSEESGRRVSLIKDWKDLFLELGDKQSLLGSLKESPFFKAFEDQGLALETKMSTLDLVLQTLNSIQRKWVYLEPIFSRGALPGEAARFKRIDDDFSDLLCSIQRDPKLFYLVDVQIHINLPDKLRTMLDQLERCQKALSDFLEAKRSSMPRFYFIGDDDLLEILGQAKNPLIIQSHLKKLFQGINKVQFNKDNTAITAMVSSANEVVKLETPVAVNEKVEEWLELLAGEMRESLAILLDKCLSENGFSWDYPSQILCLAESIRFTKAVEGGIEGGRKALDKVLKDQETMLNDLTSQDLSSDPLKQLKMKSLVFDIVHNIDVCGQLKQYRTSNLDEWQWKKQLRYYFVKEKAVIKMHDAAFDYTYEYQGNAPKLVHTPLTDKCYLTLTQGMHMGFGGNPYGPAGTGKTESIKALAGAFGRQVLVFNCDEALESASMIRIFMGIVKCGAWGCFDEFNRLKEDQLSAISQQIQIIQDSIKTKSSPIQLLGRTIDVNFNAGIFVTLNPAGKGYGGRSRLPDNLKALFRPIAMGAPDNEMIADVSLVTEGFTQSKGLASKIVSLFKLSKQLLSKQQHYDWGLRGLKAVLNSGGRLIQSYKSDKINIDAAVEYEILIKAVRVNTLSKLTFADTGKFLALIGDVFPGVESADISGGELEEAIKKVMAKRPFHLVEDSAQIKKMIQLKESLDQRMGCVIVGPSGCGKSSLWRVLKAAMIECGQHVVTHVMNPKSMHRERLLGHMDVDTREWQDGVLTDAARKVVKESPDVRCWIICDGDVDPEWIESLNSVLDDNHLLTLPNGERISFGPNVNFIFETHDLRFASPATVSRMGMIFLSDEDLDVRRLLHKWLSSLPEERRQSMSTWIDEMFYKALEYVLQSDYVVDTTLVGTVMNGLSHIKDSKSRQEFVCGLIRGIGGNLSLSQRTLLAKEIFQWAGERPPDLGAPLDCYAKGTVFKLYKEASEQKSNAEEKGGDDQEIVDQLKDLGERTVIPTITVQRTLSVLNCWIDNMEPFILVGPEGCGKSMVINHAFKQRKNIGIATLNCNAQTIADDIINKIAQSCSLYSAPEGRVYRPRDCERLVLYLKDINLPHPDMYDTCQLIAFLQQLITFDGFYDSNLEFLKIERIQIVASINAATTVGRHQLSTRFTAVVRICVVDYPETKELVSVYNSFLGTVLQNTNPQDKKWQNGPDRERLSNSIVDIYQKTREKFTVDDCRHYLFTPRDMTTWVRNLCRYDLQNENILDVIGHEACRIFRDRLVGVDACNRFDHQLNGIFKSMFKHSFKCASHIFTSLTTTNRKSSRNSEKESEGKESEGKEDEENEQVIDVMGGKLMRITEEGLKTAVIQGLNLYEREERDLNMLLFSQMLENIVHVDRILSSYSGHILLVGKNGVGRRNIVSVVVFMLGYSLYTPPVTRNYGTKQFISDIKNVLFTAGVKGEHVVLWIEDFQITQEAILEMINSLLSSGEVPGMYTHEELEPMLSPLKEIMRENGSNFRTPYDFFVSRVKQYLHVVLSMDPLHPSFLYRCESNPALYAQCSVIWIGEYRESSLRMIPMLINGIKSLLYDDDEDNDNIKQDDSYDEKKDSEDGKQETEDRVVNNVNSIGRKGMALIEMVLGIHNSAVNTLGASPRDYLVFLQAWQNLYNVKKEELLQELGHLDAGLAKLDSATDIVNDLRTNAHKQQKELAIAQTAADRAMEEISKALSSATERKIEVAEVQKTVAANEITTKERKIEIEGELEEIQPILEDAKTAVGQIKPEHLNEIRSLTAPPEAIADVLAAVLMLLGVQDLSWLSMKKFLSNRGVKEDILNYDAKRISGELRKNVAKLIKKKSTSFEAANIQRVSVAAAPLAAWVKANIKYSLVIDKIGPLQIELEEEIVKLGQSQRRLVRCEDELKEIDVRVIRLKTEFGDRTSEAERLKRNLAIAGSTLDKAENLIGQLGGEQARWKSQAKQLRTDLTKLPMKILLCAGFTTYLAKTPEDIRVIMINKWQEITSLKGFNFKRVMSTESQLLQWKNIGLPSDDLSQENSLVIVNSSDRVPFIIDPTSAATDWLKSILAEDKTRPLEVVTNHDPRFINQVELSVRFGKTLLILEVDTVEPMLYPLCRKDLVHQGARFTVIVGEKTMDYNEGFRMFLVTRNPKPDIPPDAAGLVTQINFTVTRSGLEGQLLGLAIKHEQPELEKAKGEMLRAEEDFKVQLAAMEKDLLQALATAEGNLLENSALIESLTRTKEKSAEIEEALVKSADASIKLDEQREVYRPFARTGSSIFFLVKSLQSICHMYQFSLASFITLFKLSLSAEIRADSTEERLELLCSDLEVRVLYFMGRALFKADRPMFALHLVKGMHPEKFQPKEWDIFTGSIVASVNAEVPKGYPSWAPSERQSNFKILLDNVPDLINNLELDDKGKWQYFIKSREAEKDFPSIRGISPFQKVLILQAFRPDRLQSALLLFCTDILHIDSISPPSLSIAAIHSESDTHIPLLFISSPGADPSKELEEYAMKTIGSGQYEELAMGGGQQEVAIKMLRSAAQNGSWLCLKNLHLVVSWLPTLEKELSSLQAEGEFRLWLTSEQHIQFPSILLQSSLKATFESPPGLKQNLQRVFSSWDVDSFDKTNAMRSRLLFLLGCFHAVIQERRTYCPQGWSKEYEFSYGDMKAGTFVMEVYLNIFLFFFPLNLLLLIIGNDFWYSKRRYGLGHNLWSNGRCYIWW
jgi:dynein heavy chain 2